MKDQGEKHDEESLLRIADNDELFASLGMMLPPVQVVESPVSVNEMQCAFKVVKKGKKNYTTQNISKDYDLKHQNKTNMDCNTREAMIMMNLLVKWEEKDGNQAQQICIMDTDTMGDDDILSDFLDDVFDRIQSQDMKMNGQTISYEWEYIRMIEMKGKF